MAKILRILTRAHYELGQAVCALCGQSAHSAKTGTGLYEGEIHLGDVCQQCLQVGRRGASARVRTHAADLRRIAEDLCTRPVAGTNAQYYPWLCRYASYLDELAAGVDNMTAWIPRAGQKLA